MSLAYPIAGNLMRVAVAAEHRLAMPWLSAQADRLFALAAGRASSGAALPVASLHRTDRARLYDDPEDCSEYSSQCEDFDLCETSGFCGSDAEEHEGDCPIWQGHNDVENHPGCWLEGSAPNFQVCCDCEIVTEFCPEVEGLI